MARATEQSFDARLAEADRHIADAESLIARQRSTIESLERDGRPSDEAHALLHAMIGSLEEMHAHRRIIEEEIIRAGAPPGRMR